MRTTVVVFGLLVALGAPRCTVAADVVPPFPDTLRVDRIGAERGLPSEIVNTLAVDADGFLWVGTREGLAMYDGYTARQYRYGVGDPDSLPDNDVRAILEDPDGRLWIGTTTGGLCVLDRATERFRQFRHDAADAGSLTNDSVFSLGVDRTGAIWVGTHDGLNRIDPATGVVRRYEADPERAGSLPGSWIMAIHEDREGKLWLATVGSGMARYDPARDAFESFLLVPDDPRSDANVAYAVAEDAQGGLWVGTATGLFRLDRGQGRFVEVPLSAFDRSAEERPILTSIAFDRHGILWIATWTQGVVAFDPETGTSRRYGSDPRDPTGLGSDRIGVLRVHGDDIWLGTSGAGIHRFSAESGVFADPALARCAGLDLARTEVTAVLEDRSGRIWMGTMVDGLIRCDPDGTWRTFETNPEVGRRIGTVLALAEDRDGTVWIGTMGLLLRSRSPSELAVVRGWPDREDEITPEAVTAIALDGLGFLWIGLTDGSVYRLGDGGRTFVRYAADSSLGPGPGSTNVSTIVSGPDNAIWIGTRTEGLNRLDPLSGEIERFSSTAGDPGSLSHGHVSAIVVGDDRALTVGTVGGGVDRLDNAASPPRFRHLTGTDGLVDMNVMSMLQDDDGSLWIATRQGLSRYDPASGAIRNYLLGDGIRSLKFTQRAAHKGRHTLRFGTLDGPVSIRRGTAFVSTAATPIRLVGIGVGGRPWHGTTPPWSTRRIDVDYGTLLGLEFAVLDYRSRSRYQYRFGKGDTDWVDLGANRVLSLPVLAPGRYALEVRARDSHGVLSHTPATLDIEVVPPLWMTARFRGAVVALLVVGAFVAYKRRTTILKRRNAQLTSLHHAREAALEEVRRRETELQEAYSRLRTLTHRLDESQEAERGRIARELHDQMGQALSAAKLDLKALGRLPEGASREERLRDALSLIDEMIRHVRSLTLDLRPPLLDELGLAMALRAYAEGQSSRTGIAIEVVADDEMTDLSPSTSIVAFRIVQESVNNAIRHAEARRVTIAVRRCDDGIALEVLDDGRGFDVHATLARALRGGHLGLLGMSKRVEAVGGRFEVRSEPDAGTRVYAVIPSGP